MTEYVYRHEINLAEIADEHAKRLQERVDGMALDRAAGTLGRFGYVKVIRCRDCVNLIAHGTGCSYWDYCDIESIDGFCAWAERREQ